MEHKQVLGGLGLMRRITSASPWDHFDLDCGYLWLLRAERLEGGGGRTALDDVSVIVGAGAAHR